MKNLIRVLIVDDSPVVRTILADMLTSAPGVAIAGQATDGQEAVEKAMSLRPDVITMDIRMPRLNGLEATKQIMRSVPSPIIVVASSIYSADLNIAFNAVAAGALTVVEKPRGLDPVDYDAVRDQLIAAVRLVAAVPVVALTSGDVAAPGAAAPASGGRLRPNVDLVAIAASTGGPGALRQILHGLPADLSMAIVVAQHITPGFGQGFARWLGSTTALPVTLAQDGERLVPGRVLLAPDDTHLVVTPGGVVCVERSEPLNGFRPSANRLFDSVARTCGAVALGIVLSGMGDDGASGLAALRRAGGQSIAQEESTCVVTAMPQAAIAQGVDQVLAPDAIAAELLGLHLARRGDAVRD
jgi:two-component system chemotaxis response regulator CheB